MEITENYPDTSLQVLPAGTVLGGTIFPTSSGRSRWGIQTLGFQGRGILLLPVLPWPAVGMRVPPWGACPTSWEAAGTSAAGGCCPTAML